MKKSKSAKASTKATPKTIAAELTPNEAKTLKVLKNTSVFDDLPRTKLSKATGIRWGWTVTLGAYSANGSPVKAVGLLGKRLAKGEKHDGSTVVTYRITPLGKRVLKHLDKLKSKT